MLHCTTEAHFEPFIRLLFTLDFNLYGKEGVGVGVRLPLVNSHPQDVEELKDEQYVNK
jgi:hypothetical protein